jgi:hypothetical protein
MLAVFSCDYKHSTEIIETGDMTVRVNLQPVLHHYLPITKVTALAFLPDRSGGNNLAIDSTFAIGIIPGLKPGSYFISVDIFSDSILVASGSGMGTMNNGYNPTVIIEPEISSQVYNRILLVGNSHTYYNQGVDYHLQQLIQGCFSATATACTQGGYTLQNHYNDANTINTIQQGDWDLVILQEASNIPMNSPDLFFEYATKLDYVIRESGARTGFYMTWAWKNNPEMYEPVMNAYNTIGAELQALVAPCGIAFHNALAADSTLGLFAADNYHPSLLGTFLASCVFYSTIWNTNPVNTEYVPTGIDSTTAILLKQIAWNTVQEYQASREQRKQDRMIGRFARQDANREQEQLFEKAM